MGQARLEVGRHSATVRPTSAPSPPPTTATGPGPAAAAGGGAGPGHPAPAHRRRGAGRGRARLRPRPVGHDDAPSRAGWSPSTGDPPEVLGRRTARRGRRRPATPDWSCRGRAGRRRRLLRAATAAPQSAGRRRCSAPRPRPAGRCWTRSSPRRRTTCAWCWPRAGTPRCRRSALELADALTVLRVRGAEVRRRRGCAARRGARAGRQDEDVGALQARARRLGSGARPRRPQPRCGARPGSGPDGAGAHRAAGPRLPARRGLRDHAGGLPARAPVHRRRAGGHRRGGRAAVRRPARRREPLARLAADGMLVTAYGSGPVRGLDLPPVAARAAAAAGWPTVRTTRWPSRRTPARPTTTPCTGRSTTAVRHAMRGRRARRFWRTCSSSAARPDHHRPRGPGGGGARVRCRTARRSPSLPCSA